MTQEYKGISKRAHELLNMQEGYDVDYKRSLSGLEATDLVAFANSDNGGALLIGVEEVCLENGCQSGEVVGCDVSDRERQGIFSKAESCIPPIEVEVVIENTEDKPFFRIEIPSGKGKPYCSSRGTYVIRGDGRTSPLQPNQLLLIFMEAEGSKFFEKFRDATRELEKGLDGIGTRVSSEMAVLIQSLRTMEGDITKSFTKIFKSAQSAESLSDEALGCTDETLAVVTKLDQKVSAVESGMKTMNRKVDSLLKKFAIHQK